MRALTLILIISSLRVLEANAEQSIRPRGELKYTCVSEKATGFYGKVGYGWQATSFNNVSHYKIYQVSPNGFQAPYNKGFFELYDDKSMASPNIVGDGKGGLQQIGTMEDKDTVGEGGRFEKMRIKFSPLLTDNFYLNLDTLNYSRASMNGFLQNDYSSTPWIEIGHCTMN